jgi:hypothetical protein
MRKTAVFGRRGLVIGEQFRIEPVDEAARRTTSIPMV